MKAHYRCRWIYWALALVASATFWPVLRCEFVRYDDDKYFTDNPRIKAGLTSESVIQAFTKPHYHTWHPLTTLSYLLDYELVGLKPFWHHLVNLIIHVINTVLLFGVLRRYTGAIWPSAFVAAVFAVHPLQVESVAWIAERKNVLSGFFWLLAMVAYIRYTDRPRITSYLPVILCVALGLMTKPSVVVLPFALLLLDFWPLERIRWKVSDRLSARAAGRPKYSPWFLIAEKLPMLAMASGVAVITYLAQKQGGVVSGLARIPLQYRLANAAISYLTYIEKLLWPSGLAVLYPHPGSHFSTAKLTVSIAALLLISACCLYFGRTRKYLVTGWLWHLGLLVPVIGLVQAGAQARADRYMYLTMIGPLIIIGWGLADLLGRRAVHPKVVVAGASIVLIAAMICTHLQLRHWRTGLALFKRAVEVTENNHIMLNNYANRLTETGRIDLAIECLSKCVALQPDSAESHNNLANALADKGRLEEAVVCYQTAIQLGEKKLASGRPAAGLAEAHHNLGNTLWLLARRNPGEAAPNLFEQASRHYVASLELRPDNISTLQALGRTLDALKEYDEAIGCYNKMLEIEPDNIIAHGLLGMTFARNGDLEGAAGKFRFVLSRRPNDVEMYCNLGAVLQQLNRIDEAIAAFENALRIDPNYGRAKQGLDLARQKREDP